MPKRVEPAMPGTSTKKRGFYRVFSLQTQPAEPFVRRKDIRGSREHPPASSPAVRIKAMTDIERQRIVMMATTAIAAAVWAIANLA